MTDLMNIIVTLIGWSLILPDETGNVILHQGLDMI